jgi:hypothetical protein
MEGSSSDGGALRRLATMMRRRLRDVAAWVVYRPERRYMRGAR